MYIVYKNNESGYYAGWKSKLENDFTNDWTLASKYKTIGSPILKRMGILLEPFVDTMEKFIKSNIKIVNHASVLRNIKLSEILGSNDEEYIEFINGRIEEIIDGVPVDVSHKVLKYIKSKIEKNRIYNENRSRKISDLEIKEYILESIDGEDFWDGF